MAAVVLSRKSTDWAKREIIGCDDTAFIPVIDRGEAHYLCSILNSSAVREFLYAAKPSGHVAPPSAIKPIAIPKFDPKNPIHLKLAELSEKAHKLAERNGDLNDVDGSIDMIVAKIWKA